MLGSLLHIAFFSGGLMAAQSYSPQTVATTSGNVKGHIAAWPQGAEVSEYLGIPFAQPPLGNLRWAAPVANKDNNATHAGDKYMPDCLQPGTAAAKPMLENGNIDRGVVAYGLAMGGSPDHKYSEDCLGLNVWTKPQTGDKSKAVMLWIYGGGFGAGTSNAPFYNGARLAAEQDVVVVSFNYRINVFGFPGVESIPDANPGLLDQRLAVEWVRDNIAKFGGDPKRITLFGESAGGASVDYYSYAWVHDPIVNGFIPMSGSATALPSTTFSNSWWYQLSTRLGCGGRGTGRSQETVDCMRKIPAPAILKQLEGMSPVGPIGALLFFMPVQDGKTVFSDYVLRTAAGNFIKRPMLVGSTDNELGLISGLGYGVLRGYMANGGFSGLIAAMARAGIEYMLTNSFVEAVFPYVGAGMQCSPATVATARRRHNVPAWRYRFFGEWDNVNWINGMGTYHSADVPIVFGTTQLKINATRDTPEQAKYIKSVMTAWATFAKDPDKGLEKLGWPQYNPVERTIVRLGYQNKSETTYGLVSEHDGPCQVLNLLSNPLQLVEGLSSTALAELFESFFSQAKGYAPGTINPKPGEPPKPNQAATVFVPGATAGAPGQPAATPAPMDGGHSHGGAKAGASTMSMGAGHGHGGRKMKRRF